MNCNNTNLGINSNSCNGGLRHIEQIALNKAGIDCLNGRVSRTESDIKERYTKAELDRLLAEIACKCDTYSKEELDDLLDKIACTCDCYTRDEVDSLLENKVNKGIAVKYELQLTEGVEPYHPTFYCKDNSGIVTVWGALSKSSYFTGGDLLGLLPKGFRPENTFEVACAQTDLGLTTKLALIHVRSNGEIGCAPSIVDASRLFFSFSFLAEQ